VMQEDEFVYYRDQLWTAPELLRMTTNRPINRYCYNGYYSFVCQLDLSMELRRATSTASLSSCRRSRSERSLTSQASIAQSVCSWQLLSQQIMVIQSVVMFSIYKMGGLFLQLKYRRHAARPFLPQSPASGHEDIEFLNESFHIY